ncbi:jg4553 [Pararge aegeria aegeria]|uniref:Jg4553 protein n=1 Tax=Pararge aegeria aegeria TaxID=348720 RepID=A0A8S4RPY6_9NEOP|nr:jg4553 [Pararge aegeria aegeria]
MSENKYYLSPIPMFSNTSYGEPLAKKQHKPVVETGDEPAACSNRRTLVLANHQSTADVPMLMAAWNPRPGVLSNLMWIMDRVFKFTNFGIVSVLHQDFFIQAVGLNISFLEYFIRTFLGEQKSMSYMCLYCIIKIKLNLLYS